jgi:hypothetical protein
MVTASVNAAFNDRIDRVSSDGVKWGAHAPDVVPLWVSGNPAARGSVANKTGAGGGRSLTVGPLVCQ